MRYRGTIDMLTNLSVNANTTHTVTDDEQTPLDVGGVDKITVSVKVTGGASGYSGGVIIRLATYNGQDWDTKPFVELPQVSVNGTSSEVQTFLVEIGEVEKVKVLEIENTDASNPVTVDYIKASIKS